jgi:Lon protease-like protein
VQKQISFMSELISIFSLTVVVYPGNELNLHIFELRYKQLIGDCAKTKAPFGIPTVLEGKIGRLGTLVQLNEITNVQADGQMDIRTRGLKVFLVRRLVKLYPGKLYGGAYVDYQTDQPGG